ncbi:patatin-like phospholipase family protein [Tenacibaculum sp. UWU-22]|uniref:patatin-like phospholipase family protein n=1 Tax=Tenacibaculum sp. UWU-22 TaxID=3234187 RepID=UPI0034DABC1E
MTVKKKKIGLTLSGGGARGFAHVGVLKALEEYNMLPEVISGTSMGAVIGALIAYGYTFSDIEKMALNKTSLKIFNVRGFKLGLSNHNYVRRTLESILPDTFEKLKLPFYVSATNLTTAKHEVFSSGNLIEAILASVSIPLVFKPVNINGNYYADGGLVKNLPASSIRDKCNFLIGSHVNHIPEDFTLTKTAQLLDRAIRISIYNTVASEITLCDMLIDPVECGSYDVLNFKIFDKIVATGYVATMKELKKLKLRY